MGFCLLLEISKKMLAWIEVKKLSSKYSHKFLDNPKKYLTYALKNVSKRAIWKRVETSSEIKIGNKIDGRITNISKNSLKSNLEMLQMNMLTLSAEILKSWVKIFLSVFSGFRGLV